MLPGTIVKTEKIEGMNYNEKKEAAVYPMLSEEEKKLVDLFAKIIVDTTLKAAEKNEEQ